MRKGLLVLLTAMLVLPAGCGKKEAGEDAYPSAVQIREGEQPGGDMTEESREEEPQGESREGTRTDREEVQQNEQDSVEEEFGFADLDQTVFYFSSGAGAWYTEVTIHGDGSFSGHYQDDDAGSTGDSYPYGTRYYSEFSGRFDSLEKVDDFTYKMKLVSISFAKKPETEEILDGIRWIYSTAYGLDDGGEFYLYLPGAKAAELPEEYLLWVSNVSPEKGDRLGFYGLYNSRTGDGFSGMIYEEKSLQERTYEVVTAAEEQAGGLAEELKNTTGQQDMNVITTQMYIIWDDALNAVWKMMDTELGESEMEALRTEERNWITYRDEEVEAAGQKFAGGSMEAMQRSLKAAELTRARVYELIEYAKNRE